MTFFFFFFFFFFFSFFLLCSFSFFLFTSTCQCSLLVVMMNDIEFERRCVVKGPPLFTIVGVLLLKRLVSTYGIVI